MNPLLPVALILAAGAGSRLGGVPKGLVLFDGEPALLRVLRACREGGCERFVIVLGSQADRHLPFLPPADPALRIVIHPHWAAGRTSSLQAGLRAIGEDQAVLLHPVDVPLVPPAVHAALIAAMAAVNLQEKVRLVPIYAEHPGHPILFTHALTPELLALPPAVSPRALFATGTTLAVQVESPAIHQRIQTREDVAAMGGAIPAA